MGDVELTTSNRGKSLEHALNKYIQYLESTGIHAHKNHPARSFEGKFLAGEPFDYEIFRDGKFIAFDAKECQSDSFKTTNCKLSQIKSLQDIARHGGDAFFLVYFTNLKKLIKYKVEDVKKYKSLKPEQGEEMKLNDL